MEIDKLLERADSLFEQGESKSEVDFAVSLTAFRQGINCLLNAFLVINEVTLSEQVSLNELFKQCYELEPEFEAIEAEVNWILDPDSNDSEELVDTANEIWDFVIDLLSE